MPHIKKNKKHLNYTKVVSNMIKYVLWFYALCSKCHNDLVHNYNDSI